MAKLKLNSVEVITESGGTATLAPGINPEGTVIKSTGESGGAKFLREDGDGTSSWQAIEPGAPSITDNGDANAMTIGSDESITLTGSLTGTSLKQNSNQNLTGTYAAHELFIADGYTLTGTISVTDDLVLTNLSDDVNSITLTPDGNSRTITGTGSIESSTLAQTPVTSVDGMTGELGSTVTGSPNLNLDNATGSPAISLDNATAPAFLVQAIALSNLTVNTEITLPYATVIKNVGGGAFGSNTYTAPVSGLYQINVTAYFTGFPNNVTNFQLKIVSSNRTLTKVFGKYINAEHSTNYTEGFTHSSLVDLDANDTVNIHAYQTGGSSAGDLQAGSSYFSGFLVSKY